MKKFDYYIFVDYSEDLIGYGIIKDENAVEVLPKLLKFNHYKGLKNRKLYLKGASERIERFEIKSYFEKIEIRSVRYNVELFTDILDFIRRNDNNKIFISIDDYQYKKLKKLIFIVDGGNVKVVKESLLKKSSNEYKINLVIDNLLNIKRKIK